jgi:hypothetical protein
MIPSAPTDFWDRVIDRLARHIWDRETSNNAFVSTSMERRIALTKTPSAETEGVHPGSEQRSA